MSDAPGVETEMFKAILDDSDINCGRCQGMIFTGQQFGFVQFRKPMNINLIICISCWQDFWRKVAG